MGSFLKSRKFHIARRIFRWTRIAVWFGIFLVVAAVAYLHLIGLPEFLKAALLARLAQAGFEARFTSVQLGWGPDLTIENAFFRRADQALAPRLSAGLTRLNFDLDALRNRRLQIRSFQVEDGELEFPLSTTNAQSLSVNNVYLGIDFPGSTVLQIAEATGDFHGIQIALNATVTNYAAVRGWKPFHLRAHANETFQEQLRKLAQTLDQIHFRSAPRFHFHVTADGRDPDSLRAEMTLSADKTRTPWGQANSLQLSAAAAHLAAAGSRPFLRAQLSCAEFSNSTARAGQLDLTTVLSRSADSNFEGAVNLSASRLHLDVRSAVTNNWFDTGRIKVGGAVSLAATNFAPLSGAGKIQAWQVASRAGSAQEVEINLAASSAGPMSAGNTNWGFWSKMAGYTADWRARFVGVASPKLQLESLDCSGLWRAPLATLDKIDARLYGRRITASAFLDIDSREFRVKGHSDVDPHRVAQLLTPAAQRFLVQYAWDNPPEIDADTRFVLPAWGNRPPDWRARVLPTVQVAGQFSVGSASFRGIPVVSAQSRVTYTNRVWDLPRIHAIRADGEADIAYTGDEISHEFHFGVDSRMDLNAVRPLLPPAAQTWLDELRFTNAPAIHGEVWGRWRAHEHDGFMARLSATNFWFRGQPISGLDAVLEYTNRLLRVTDLRLSQETRYLTASMVDADISSKKCAFTNVVSTLDLNGIRNALGPRTPKLLQVLHFDTPPTLTVFGSFVASDPMATDIHFAISGEHFHWTNLTADKISGVANWHAREVALTNVQATLYDNGTLAGWGVFDYQPKLDTGFRGHFAAKNISLRALVRSWSKAPSRLEGMLDGDVVITGGDSKTNTSWNGYGDLHAHQAMLWDIPMFGIFSPLLNDISSGLGDSRANDASATFDIVNGVITTDNLEIHATGMTLLYRGTLGPDKQVNARVEAQLLKKIPAIGPMLGMVLSPLSKLFEYKISGPINKPAMEPLYVPKFLLKVMRPFHTLKTLLPNPPADNPPVIPPATPPK